MEKKLDALKQISEHFGLKIEEMFFEGRAEDLVVENGSIQDVFDSLSNWHSGCYIEKGEKFVAVEKGQAKKGDRRQNYYVVNIDNVNYWYED
jgi:hypothetical protein